MKQFTTRQYSSKKSSSFDFLKSVASFKLHWTVLLITAYQKKKPLDEDKATITQEEV